MHNLKKQIQLYFCLGKGNITPPLLFILQSVKIKGSCILKGAAGMGLCGQA